MTKEELMNLLKDIPDNSQIDIYDLRNFSHPKFSVNTEQYFDYDNGTPIVTIELEAD